MSLVVQTISYVRSTHNKPPQKFNDLLQTTRYFLYLRNFFLADSHYRTISAISSLLTLIGSATPSYRN